MSNGNSNNLSWEAWEFKHYPKNPGWYVTLISIAVLAIAFFVIVQNDIFAAVSVGLIAVIVVLFSRQTPRKVQIELNSKGIKFDSLSYPYKQLKYFWVVNNDRHKTINFHTTAFINNTLILELENQDPDAAREYLLKYLPEHEETEETAIQKIMHRMKF